MVLSRLRTPGPEAGRGPAPREREDSPTTFAELLRYSRDAWGDKVLFQQKTRGNWIRYTHREVYAAAHDMAAGLHAAGVRRGERVAIILENGCDWAIAYYAVVLTGAVAVPIYYDLKPAEIEAMLKHADPSVAIVSQKVRQKISALWLVRTVIVAGVERSDDGALSLADIPAMATAESRRAVENTVIEPDDLASIVFTSGTSGGNKGVMLTHRNFMANCRSVRRSIPFNERDRLVMVLPLHHAFPFIVSIAVAPAVGGEVTFENDLRRIRDRMAEVKPTLFLGVPALFEVMHRNIVHGIEAQGRLENFQKGLRIVEATKQRTGINIGRIVFRELHKRLGGSLRFMVSGGAALNPATARDFSLLGVPILQGWGLSEAAPVLSVQRWHPRRFYMSNWYEDRMGSIGEPLDGIEIGLIDVPEKELYVHLHGEGELVARGDNVTPGYWRSEEESRAIKVGAWLRTGDVGYIDADGQIWITGRSKFVIVLESGEKVHPDEVEEKLERSPIIEDVVVRPRKLRGKTQVTAVVYPAHDAVLEKLDGATATPEAVLAVVREAIAEQESDVAAYKRTADVMLTDEPLPRTPIRKVMRGHIRDTYEFNPARWAASWAESQQAAAAPAGEEEMEEALAPA